VHYVPSDKLNSSIRIRRIFKAKLHIRRMQILTSFVTLLLDTVTKHSIQTKAGQLSNHSGLPSSDQGRVNLLSDV